MKKLLAVGVIVLFISVSVIPSTGTTDVKQTNMPTAKGDTLYVGGNGTGNYSKIQDAIDDASNGDTVFVYDDSSPYYENLVVDKSINLKGEYSGTTVIDGNQNGDVVYVSADWVNISGFSISNCEGGPLTRFAGVKLNSSYNIVVGNNLIDNYGAGLYVETNNAYNTISDNQ